MIGSLRVLWPWPNGTTGTELSGPGVDLNIEIEDAEPFVSGPDPIVPIVLAVIAAAVVIGLATFARRREHTNPEPAILHDALD
jgi:hypothetical protein